MKDNQGNEILVGDLVKVVNGIEGMIEIDNTYKVEGLREEEGRIVVTDDRGLEGWYKADRFTKEER